MSMKFASLILAGSIIVMSAASARAVGRDMCANIFVTPRNSAPQESENKVLNSRRFLTPGEAHEILEDKDMPFYGDVLKETIAFMRDSSRASSLSDSREAFKEGLRKALKKREYTSDLIEARVRMIDQNGVKNWRVILGDLSLKDVHHQFYGSDLAHPSPDSLLGEYLAETGARTRMIRFDKHDGTKTLGPKRLMVAVSEDSWPALQRILKSVNYMTIMGHAATITDGHYFPNEGGKNGKTPRLPRPNELMPMLLMKTTEAQRYIRYTWLTADPRYGGWHDGLKIPWLNKDYCAVGGYKDCTHWIANIPIGDKLVSSYTFPPNYEEWSDLSPRTGPLKEFSPPSDKEELSAVWKVPGHQQLADLIGQQSSNIRGDMASPGGVQMVLYARTKTSRVPIVFWVTDDHQKSIPKNPPTFSEPIK